MGIALVSDIHSNQAALGAVLESIRAAGHDPILCLGDTVGYNARPNECVAAIRSAGAGMVQGNHDWASTTGEPKGFNPVATAGVHHARRVLTQENADFLGKLPTRGELNDDRVLLRYYHGSPKDPLMEYLFPQLPAPAWREMAKAAGNPDVVAVGHTHIPMQREVDGTLFVNPGSVGQPRDGDPRASYGVLNARTLEFEIVRVEYDIDETAKANEAAGLPEATWKRLYRGL